MYFGSRLPFTPRLYKSGTYYPELQRKSAGRIFLEQWAYILKYGEPEGMYFVYGLDIKNFRNKAEYLPYSVFRSQRNKLNLRDSFFLKGAEHFNYLCLLRDKFYFGKLVASCGFTTPENLYLLFGTGEAKLLDIATSAILPLSDVMKTNINAYCKLVLGECGRGVFALQVSDGNIFVNGRQVEYETFVNSVRGGTFLIQRTMRQHREMSRLYAKSVNTLRVITCLGKRGQVHVLSAVLRVGANGNVVDNWAAGGLVVGINADGTLKKYGFYEVGEQKKVDIHPDTGVRFEGFRLPYYNELLEQSCELHRLFYGIPCIGWDVAITDNGPCFIEGNDNFEISLNQVGDKGLWKEWKDWQQN